MPHRGRLSTFGLKRYKCVERGREHSVVHAPRTLAPPSPVRPFSPLFMPSFFRLSFLFLSFLIFGLSSASHLTNGNRIAGLLQPRAARDAPRKISRRSCRPSRPALVGPCFPALGFQMPSDVPANMTGWWCNPSDEYGFLGFSYEVTACEFLHIFSRSSSVYPTTHFFLQVRA